MRPACPHVISSAAIVESGLLPAFIDQALAFQQAFEIPEERAKLKQRWAGKEAVSFFLENSTRTRSSFELACQRLGMDVLAFDAQQSSLSKGETIEDTIEAFIAMGVDVVVLRQTQEGLMQALVNQYGEAIHFINAGEGKQDHPTQGLLDVLTLAQHCPDGLAGLRGRRICIVGDVLHSRVVGALLPLLASVGLQIRIIAPPYFCPDAHTQSQWTQAFGVEWHTVLSDALAAVDYVYGLRIQQERLQHRVSLEAFKASYQLTPELLRQCGSTDVRFLHPGPVNRGVEATSALVDDPQLSLVSTQIRNGVFMRMSVLDACLLS